MKSKVDIFTHHYFPYYMIILGIVLVPVIFIPVYPLLSVGVAVLSVLFISTHYRVRIDMDKMSYLEYLWIAGFKSGKVVKYEVLKYLYINKLNRDEEYGLVGRMSYSKDVYAGFLKLENGTTLYIGESSNEKKMLKKVKELAKRLEIEMRKNY